MLTIKHIFYIGSDHNSILFAMKHTLFLCKILLSLILSVTLLTRCVQKESKHATIIKIDVNKTGAPIEKYIYGQFIEHLGKCIYGGIWAEMIEDRKFYYPITWEFDPFDKDTDPFWNTGPYQYLKASPWQVIGNESTVVMDGTNPFTGNHTPVFSSTSGNERFGLRQAGLGLLGGHAYEGRIILAGDEAVLPITIRFIARTGEIITLSQNEITKDFFSYPFEFTSDFSCDSTTIEIYSEGKGQYKIGTLSLMPRNNISGWREDVVALMKELNAPVYRWPGGNFVSGYNWKDGTGDRDKRPPRKNPAWKGVEHNDVGIHEYMELMNILNAEPFIAVNTGLGTVEEVAEEIEYCNGSLETPMGKRRAGNGHPEPYGVKWWAVGNEMYGEWQLGHMPLSDYVKKHIAMAEAIWERDPEAQLIAVGAVGEWSETMLSESSDHMNLLSEHIYVKELEDVAEHTGQLKNNIRRVAEAHRKYREQINDLAGKNIRIAMDEWNYWYGDYIYGELGVRYHHKDALGVAIGLHEYFRNSDMFFMANYAQTVNVIGCIKTTATAAGFAATGLPLKLYRNHFGAIPVILEHNAENLDVAAALNEGRDKVTMSLVNVYPEPHTTYLDFGATRLQSEGKLWIIHNNDPEAYNVPGETQELQIIESDVTINNKGIKVPGYSILMVEFEILP
jgi:alpha-N-arabinofuranosidase